MIECIKFRPHNKGCLEGFADLFVDKWGIEIYGCTLYCKNGQRWLNLPAKETDDNGEKKFFPTLRFRDKKHWEVFIEKAKEAIDKYRKENMQEQSTNNRPEKFEGAPF